VEQKAADLATTVYESCPPTMWPRPRRTPEPARFWSGELRSASLLLALDTLTRERRPTRAGVLTGTLATVAATAAGLESALLFTISGNRSDPEWRDYPGRLSQEAILHVPVGQTVAETMRTAMAETLRSLSAARYAPATMHAVRDQAERSRGVSFDKQGSALVLNLISGTSDSGATPKPSTFTWTRTTDRENLGFSVDAYPQAGEFVLAIRVDTALMSPAEAETWVRTMEWAVVSSVSRDVPTEEVRTRLTGQGNGFAG
jgi:hypothetical protein